MEPFKKVAETIIFIKEKSPNNRFLKVFCLKTGANL
jgi:hypothetical protein